MAGRYYRCPYCGKRHPYPGDCPQRSKYINKPFKKEDADKIIKEIKEVFGANVTIERIPRVLS